MLFVPLLAGIVLGTVAAALLKLISSVAPLHWKRSSTSLQCTGIVAALVASSVAGALRHVRGRRALLAKVVPPSLGTL